MAFTRTPTSPHSMASTRVIMSMPALAAQACTWYMVGFTPCGAEMLMTLAPGFLSIGYARRSTWKLPFRSMSITVLKPLGDRSAAGAMKLPAAPEISTSMSPNCACAWRSAASTAAGSRTSALIPSACAPSARRPSAACCTLSGERLMTTTRAPARANAWAMPRLMPLVPPATKTWRPAKEEDSAMAPSFQSSCSFWLRIKSPQSCRSRSTICENCSGGMPPGRPPSSR